MNIPKWFWVYIKNWASLKTLSILEPNFEEADGLGISTWIFFQLFKYHCSIIFHLASKFFTIFLNLIFQSRNFFSSVICFRVTLAIDGLNFIFYLVPVFEKDRNIKRFSSFFPSYIFCSFFLYMFFRWMPWSMYYGTRFFNYTWKYLLPNTFTFVEYIIRKVLL